MSKENKAIVAATIAAFIILVVMLLTTSCKTIQVVPEIHTEYVHDTIREQHVDSVWQDRWHTEFTKGDTVYVKDSTSRVQVKTDDKVKVVEVAVHDSVPYAVEVEKVVTKNSRFARFAIWHTIGTWIILLAALAIWLFKKFYLRR